MKEEVILSDESNNYIIMPVVVVLIITLCKNLLWTNSEANSLLDSSSLSKIIVRTCDKKDWNFFVNKCRSSLIFLPLDAIILFQSFIPQKKEEEKLLHKVWILFLKKIKTMNIFHENRTVIKYHCHKHASFLPIPFCVYSGLKETFIPNFLLYAF